MLLCDNLVRSILWPMVSNAIERSNQTYIQFSPESSTLWILLIAFAIANKYGNKYLLNKASSFLKMGITFAILNWSGKQLNKMKYWKRESEVSQWFFSGLRLSKPVDVLVLKEETATLKTLVWDTGKRNTEEGLGIPRKLMKCVVDSMELAK